MGERVREGSLFLAENEDPWCEYKFSAHFSGTAWRRVERVLRRGRAGERREVERVLRRATSVAILALDLGLRDFALGYDPHGIIPMVELPGKIPVVLPVILTLSKLYRVE